MQGPNSNSTLELVVNEQQLQNMSQIDLTRPGERSNETSATATQNSYNNYESGITIEQLKRWPTRFRESFNAKLDEAKSKSETRTQFVFEVINAFSSIVIWILCFVCTITIPVFLFIIGLTNLDDCPDRPPLPYLIFSTGFVMTASNLFNLALALDLPILTNHHILTSDIKNTIASIINMIFNCVVTFLYILSAYMVFTIGNRKQFNNSNQVTPSEARNTREEPPQPDEGNSAEIGNTNEQPIDCDWLLYHFSFWFITLSLGLVVILFVVATALYAYNRYRLAIIRGSTPRSQANTTNSNNPIDPYATNRV